MRIKRTQLILAFGIALIITAGLTYWNINHSPAAKQKALAIQYCSSCHIFPEPSLLDKETWGKRILPQMAFRMGFPNNQLLLSFAPQDAAVIRKTLPDHPLLSDSKFEQIRQYYLNEAPDELSSLQEDIHAKASLRSSTTLFDKQYITLLRFDAGQKRLYAGTAESWLYALDKNFTTVDSFKLPSAPTHIDFDDHNVYVTTVGKLLPSDQPLGTLHQISLHDKTILPIVDSLQRPVYFSREDMNNDGHKDFIICSFGNYTGNLTLRLNRGDDTYTKKIISTSPGCRKAVAVDWNNDGKKDILALIAQGDERISVFVQEQNNTFKEKILVRFPPVYGSSNFDIADFNGDQHPDVIVTNGDNGDYSNIPKPYHGIRIFENDKNQGLKEVWFYRMPGAWDARPIDFDHDGDLDLAAISYFPDNKNHPEQNFIYFTNDGDYHFTPSLADITDHGEWIVMEAADIDDDGNTEILLGSCPIKNMQAVKSKIPENEQINLLFLKK